MSVTMGIVRVAVALVSVLLLVAGIVMLANGVTGAWLTALMGVGGLFGVLFERVRYRSEAAERATRRGPDLGGADPEPPGEPFRRTDEEFLDPTTRRRTRVYVNPATGERRYHAER